jgi:KRAB domain-containing zinc finger protein
MNIKNIYLILFVVVFHSECNAVDKIEKRVDRIKSTMRSGQVLARNDLEFLCEDTETLKKLSEVDSEKTEKTYKCPLCRKELFYVCALKDHIALCHLSEIRYYCTYKGCGKSFHKKESLSSHILTHSTSYSKERPFVCTYEGCGKSFYLRNHLEKHEDIHREKIYICDVCNRSFSTSAAWGSHNKLYGDRQHYPCQYCHNIYETESALNEHEKKHKSDDAYECNICHKKFKTSDILNTHKNIHDKKRSFVCTYEGCGKSFGDIRLLKRHEKIHAEKYQYKCSRCNKSFCRKDSFILHQKRKNPCKKDYTV